MNQCMDWRFELGNAIIINIGYWKYELLDEFQLMDDFYLISFDSEYQERDVRREVIIVRIRSSSFS